LAVILDYLVIGHATRDLRGHSSTVGGTVVYAARTARALGCQVGVITSADADLDLGQALPDVLVARFLTPTTTTFENTNTEGGRQQVIHHVSRALVPSMAPDDWRAAIVHIGPVAQECHPGLASAFREAFVGVTPQGWMRQWDDAGRVSQCQWRGMEGVLARADAVVLSLEDLGGDWDLAAEYASQTRLLAVTQGADGCTVYSEGEIRRFAAREIDEEDSTGAGDIFAASFFCALRRSSAPEHGHQAGQAAGHRAWAAARFANCVAAGSVTRSGPSSTPSVEEVARCEQATLRNHTAERSGDGDGDAHYLCTG
jgi:sugar/nucleoside kinase (ribokinase family)